MSLRFVVTSLSCVPFFVSPFPKRPYEVHGVFDAGKILVYGWQPYKLSIASDSWSTATLCRANLRSVRQPSRSCGAAVFFRYSLSVSICSVTSPFFFKSMKVSHFACGSKLPSVESHARCAVVPNDPGFYLVVDRCFEWEAISEPSWRRLQTTLLFG